MLLVKSAALMIPLIELVQQLVAKPSVTPNDKGCQSLLCQHLKCLDFAIEHFPFAEVNNFWARRGKKSPLLVFVGHTDVVPAGPLEKWETPPFMPTIRNGQLYGRGSADMKGSLAAMLVACRKFIHDYPHHHGSIAWLITSDEEGPGIQGIAKVTEVLKKRNEKIDYCLVGEALVEGGWHVLNWHGLLPVLIAIVLSPLLGLSISWLLIKLTHTFLKDIDSSKTQCWARRAQFIAGALLSLGHGGNDAQKTMGIIAVLLFSTGLLNGHFYIPFWVIISCNFVMGLGTLIGGWRIVNTLGNKITQLTPLSGGCAATGAALTLFAATDLGIPVSTTHTVTGAILGVGSTNGWLNTHWPTIRRIMWAWALTIPAAGLVASVVMILAIPLKFSLH